MYACFAKWAKSSSDVLQISPINKILTIEASGIGIACVAAECFDMPVVFAKKSQSVNIDGDVYVSEVESFTHKRVNRVIVSKKFLGPRGSHSYHR